MLSRFLDKGIRKADDKFLKEVTSAEGLQNKIKEIRYQRSSANLCLYVIGFFLIVLMLLSVFEQTAIDLPPMLYFAFLFTLIIYCYLDIQLKMLLLADKNSA